MTTNRTIPPKNRGVEKKTGEILRLLRAMEVLNIQPIDLANKSGLSERTVKNAIWENKPISGRVLRAINTHFQVSMDWIASGKGAMFCKNNTNIKEDAANYGNNPRTERIVDFVNEFMSFAGDDEQAWLETQMKINIQLYKDYLVKNGRWETPPLGYF